MKHHVIWFLLAALAFTACGTDTESQSQSKANPSAPRSSEILARALETPSDFLGEPVLPRISAELDKPIPTNDWWTSLIWPFYPGNAFGENLYAHPLVLKAHPDGLGLGVPKEATVTPDQVHYTYHYQEDLKIGVAGLSASEIKVHDFSTWTVTPRWESGDTWMNATIGHGLLFTYVKTNAGTALASVPPNARVFAQVPGALGIEVQGQAYGLYAPHRASWSRSGTHFTAELQSYGYYSVALLPRADLLTLESFHQRAFSFVTETTVDWRLDQGQVETTYQLEVEAQEGTVQDPPIALYRHQWLATSASLEDWSFHTARGQMKGLISRQFTTLVPFSGVLPNLPLAADNTGLIQSFLEEVRAEGPLADKDTYFGGKDLGKLSALVPIAEQVGREDLKELWLNQIQQRLDNYFDGELPYRFTYDATWQTLLAEPVAFESDRYLNDHHFHYGYLLMGAATLARYRPEWADSKQYQVEEMILDVANPDHQNKKYPFLRNFDPYAGHSWASGAQNFAGGNNQESSSEAVHFASALVLWGEETQQSKWTELGAYLYATEVQSIWQYWFDKDEVVFPTEFSHPILGIVWGGGGAYATWWTDNPEEIHGINFLPIHGGSLYLGHHTDALARNLDHLKTQAGEILEWRDILWSAEAFLSPAEALGDFLAIRPTPEGGESRAHTYHWLSALSEYGSPLPDITCNLASFAVLNKDDSLTYIAYNPTSQPVLAKFSNGYELEVSPHTVAVGQDSSKPSTPFKAGLLPSTLPSDFHLAAPTDGLWVGTPNNSQVLRIEAVNADYDGTELAFDFPVDAGTAIGSAVQVEFRFDFEGDGVVDKRDVYHYFPTNDIPGTENYRQDRGLLISEGTYRDLVGGRVEIEFWTPIGRGPIEVLSQQSKLEWPFTELSVSPGEPTEPLEPTVPESPVTESLGLSTFYFGPGALAEVGEELLIAAGDGLNHDGEPFRSRTWSAVGLQGFCLESEVELSLPVDSGEQIANAIQARLLYDFDGDGVDDRTTTLSYFPTNDVSGYEVYHSNLVPKHSEGQDWRAFAGGKVTVEIWSALGSAPGKLSNSAFLSLPLR